MLEVLSFNTRLSGPCHDAALRQAALIGAFAIFIQEPWVSKRDNATKTLRGYTLWGPATRWQPRPRALIYTKSGVPASQLPSTGGDVVAVSAAGVNLVNIYNEPRRDVRWVADQVASLPGRTLLAGDFNARHPRWVSWEEPSAGTEALLSNLPVGMALLNPVDVPTHKRGGVLDLAWTNIPGSDATVSEYHTVGSDHLPLHISLQCNMPRPGHTLLRTVDEDLGAKMRDFLTLLPLGPLNSAKDIDQAAQQLQECIIRAHKAVCTRTVSGAACVPWWQPSLSEARRLARQTDNWGPFRKEVRKAKAEYWARQINEAKDTDIWRIGRWRHKRDPLGAPPLKDGEEVCITGQEKAECFLRRLLAKAARNPAPALEGPPAKRLPGVPLPSLVDTKDCLLGSGNTAPGLDRLTTNVLQSVWETIGARVQAIYTACLIIGHHPRAWKEARVVMVPKPKKDDASNPRNWRPIALLSVLSKGLERYVARWLAYLAVNEGVLSPTHFGAMPRRATLDLVLAFVSRIEAALKEGKHAALLLQDVEGAFDGVSHARLLSRLRLQGWDARLLRWIASWLHQRKVTVATPAGQASGSPNGGVPQGSPLSPILFALYMEPFAWARRRGVYADDVATLVIARTLDGVDAQLQEKHKENEELAAACGVNLAAEKEECQRFTQKRKVPPHWQPGHTRWLGYILDSKLSHKEHVRQWTGKARQIASFVRSLGGSQKRGLPPAAASKLIRACALPTALHGAEVYAGKARHLGLLEAALDASARAVVPAWRTTPNRALRREAGLPGAQVLLKDVQRRVALRIRRLDPAHLLRRPAADYTSLHALQDGALNVPAPPLAPPVATPNEVPVWDKGPFPPFRDVTVYSDGSKLTNGGTGGGYHGQLAGRPLFSHHFPLGRKAEVYDAEMAAAVHGAENATRAPATHLAERVHVVLDNLAAVRNLQPNRPSVLSPELVARMDAARKTWARRERAPHVLEGEIKVWWTPGHAGLKGNEEADRLAKLGAALIPSSPLPPTASHLRRERRALFTKDSRKWWKDNAPLAYQNLGVQWQGKPKELMLARPVLGKLVQHRTGHGDFGQYHRRWNHPDAEISCSCGREKTPVHFFFCKKIRRRVPPDPWLQKAGVRGTVDWVLGTAEGATRWAEVMHQTSFFQDICPHRWAPGPST